MPCEKTAPSARKIRDQNLLRNMREPARRGIDDQHAASAAAGLHHGGAGPTITDYLRPRDRVQ
jgi:hypothetical protein